MRYSRRITAWIIRTAPFSSTTKQFMMFAKTIWKWRALRTQTSTESWAKWFQVARRLYAFLEPLILTWRSFKRTSCPIPEFISPYVLMHLSCPSTRALWLTCQHSKSPNLAFTHTHSWLNAIQEGASTFVVACSIVAMWSRRKSIMRYVKLNAREPFALLNGPPLPSKSG